MDYENQETTYVEQPKDYKGLSITGLILSILCCCSGGGFLSIANLVTSIIALTKSNEVQNCINSGNINGALSASNTAKTLNIVTFVLLALWFLLALIVWVFYGAVIIASLQSM